jgi:hypothetical protein
MSLSAVLAGLWGLAATVVAFLPWRMQFPPGLVLLVTAPGVIVFLGIEHGPLIALAGLAAFVSMFRRPLGHLGRLALARLRGGR